MRIFLAGSSSAISDELGWLIDGMAGFDVSICGQLNSDETIKAIIEMQPDIILLDVHMDHDRGFDVLRTVKTKLTNTKTIALVNALSLQHRIMCQALDIDYFLDKRTELYKIPNLLSRILLRNQHRELAGEVA